MEGVELHGWSHLLKVSTAKNMNIIPALQIRSNFIQNRSWPNPIIYNMVKIMINTILLIINLYAFIIGALTPVPYL